MKIKIKQDNTVAKAIWIYNKYQPPTLVGWESPSEFWTVRRKDES